MISSPRTRRASVPRLISLWAGFLFLVTPHSRAGSATWQSNPATSDWHLSTNWSPNTIPNSPADTAFFRSSTVTGVNLGADTEVATIDFSPRASAYSLIVYPYFNLTLSGTGVANRSAVTQNFANVGDTGGAHGSVFFNNGASAGALVAYSNRGSLRSGYFGSAIEFRNNASAGSADFTNLGGQVSGAQGGYIQFFDNATSGEGTFSINGGAAGGAGGALINFFSSSTAANGKFTLNGGAASDSGTSYVQFYGDSSAGAATFDNVAGAIFFRETSTAGGGIFTVDGGTVPGRNGGSMQFLENSSAGNATFVSNGAQVVGTNGAFIDFYDTSSAAQAKFTLKGGAVENGLGGHISFSDASTSGSADFEFSGGSAFFFGQSSAGNSTFTASTAGVTFYGDSTAANANFVIAGATPANANHGNATFQQNATPGTATFVVNGSSAAGQSGGIVSVYSPASHQGVFEANGGTVDGAFGGIVLFSFPGNASEARVTANGASFPDATGGAVLFHFDATAGNSVISAHGGLNGGRGGHVRFENATSGGTAQLQIFDNAALYLSDHDPGSLTIGSLAGNGLVYLGANTLAVGSNNLTTIFSGTVQENEDQPSGAGGALRKIGTGSLTLSGANSYTGGTTIESGTLLVTTKRGSGTGSGNVQVNGGTLGGSGLAAGGVTVGTGAGAGALIAPAAGSAKQGAFTIQSALTMKADATYICTIKARKSKARTDVVRANGVTIENGASFNLSGAIQGALSQGLSFVVLDNTSSGPTIGTFSDLPDGAIVSLNGNNFRADYHGEDGNDLTLTVVP